MIQRRQQPDGSLAQLGEHLPYKQRVTGSSPVTSTKRKAPKHCGLGAFLCLFELFTVSQGKRRFFCFGVNAVFWGFLRVQDVGLSVGAKING